MEQTLDRGPLVATVRRRTSLSSQIVTIIAVAVPPFGLLSAMGVLWGVGFGPVSLATLVVMYTLCGLGITVGFHRLFTHGSFETSKPVRALWAVLGCMAMQGPLTQWVTDHRKHHALSDQAGELARGDQAAADVIQPDRLSEVTQLLQGVHGGCALPCHCGFRLGPRPSRRMEEEQAWKQGVGCP